MYQLPTLIEDIRTALTNPGLVAPDQLEEYAHQYAEECTKLNERLKQCVAPLRSGNISEAVRLAEMPPSIIETFSLLDFLGKEEWFDTCDNFGFELPPPLAGQLFQELNNAYLQTSSLEPLLEMARFHALNGSPLRHRLAVLRAIAKADPMNLAIQTDQKTFETARLEEMGQEIAKALAKSDPVWLQDLYRELTESDWVVPPPKEFIQRICTAVLEKQADELIEQFSAFEYPQAAAIYQTMLKVLRAGSMRMPTAIERSIRAVVQWLQDTENEAEHLSGFQTAIERLREALEVYTPREELEDLYYELSNAATRANMVIPRELETYYHSRIGHLTRVERNRYMIVLAVFVCTIILVGVVIAYAIWERAHSAQVDRALETLQKVKSENRFGDIEQTLNAIKPKIRRDPRVAPAFEELQRMLDEEYVRTEAFERYCTLAELQMEQNPDLKELTEVKRSIDQADKLKRTPQETTRYTELRSKYNRLFLAAQLEADRDFDPLRSEYQRRFDNLPRSPGGEYSLDELTDEYKKN